MSRGGIQFALSVVGLVATLVSIYFTLVQGADFLNALGGLVTQGHAGDRISGFAGSLQLALFASLLFFLLFCFVFAFGYVFFGVFKFFDITRPLAASVLFLVTLGLCGLIVGIMLDTSLFWTIFLAIVTATLLLAFLTALFASDHNSTDGEFLAQTLIFVGFASVVGFLVTGELTKRYGSDAFPPSREIRLETTATVFVRHGETVPITESVSISSSVGRPGNRYSGCRYVLATPHGLFEGSLDLDRGNTPSYREHIRYDDYYKVSLVSVSAASSEDRGCLYSIGIGSLLSDGESDPV